MHYIVKVVRVEERNGGFLRGNQEEDVEIYRQRIEGELDLCGVILATNRVVKRDALRLSHGDEP